MPYTAHAFRKAPYCHFDTIYLRNMKYNDYKDEALFEGPDSGEYRILPVMSLETNKKSTEIEIPHVLPILAMRDAVLFPGKIIPITIGREKSKRLLKAIGKTTNLIGAVTQLDSHDEDPGKAELYEVGTVAKILKTIELPGGSVAAFIEGIRRFNLVEMVSTEPYLIGQIELLPDNIPSMEDNNVKALADTIKEYLGQVFSLTKVDPAGFGPPLSEIDSFEFLVNHGATCLQELSAADRMALLTENDLLVRGQKLVAFLSKQIELLKLREEIQIKAKTQIDQQQREYFLNNQLKTIQEELGMDSSSDDANDLRKKAADKKWPEYAKKEFEKGVARLERLNPSTPDYNVELNYLQFMVNLPWDIVTEDNLDLNNAKEVLEADHYGLEKIKERILEFLAVLKLRKNMKSPILCLYGPPGTGKTSLGKSIARALGRKYQRISLGGLHDESEIRGHRKTYIGAMPGRILQAINRAGSSNPVIVLDEIDKVSSDVHGDPSSALLEALDPEQNTTFHDNFLDIDYDLSKVLFVTTANDVSVIQPALRDRMEMIELSGYISEEKSAIANNYLIPKQIEEHGLTKEQLVFGNGAVSKIIDEYTRESGVRQLDKRIAKIARRMAMKVAMQEAVPEKITPKMVKEILGLPTNTHDLQKDNEAAGVVTGLAWTQVGGEILFIECSRSDGKGELSTTGNLGDVMKESATIAYKYLKAHPQLLGMQSEDLKKYDLHIHVPEGAIPKDGPSAGITMVSAMASALMDKKVKSGIAMTGEMTLRGRVLPVGGIKEKILAAKRAGVNTIILSEENKKDVSEIKNIYVKGLTFKYVKSIDEVIEYIF